MGTSPLLANGFLHGIISEDFLMKRKGGKMQRTSQLNVKYPVYAHTGKSGVGEELLEDHVKRCVKYWERINHEKNISDIFGNFWKELELVPGGSAWNFAEECFLQVISRHDDGKCNPGFQIHIMKNPSLCMQQWRGWEDTGHSLLSAILYLDFFMSRLNELDDITKEEKRVLKRLIWENSFIISRHHSDLVRMEDYLNSFDNQAGRLLRKLENNELPGIEIIFLRSENMGRLISQYEQARSRTNRKQDIILSFYCRLVYSILVACDYYAATEFMNGVEVKEFGNADYDAFKKLYDQTDIMHSIRIYEKEKYGNGSWQNSENINDLRCEIFLEAEENLKSASENIYFLESPTGSGKSNTSMNLSFQLLRNKNKLLYIYPFNTLVEQNLDMIRRTFENQEVMEQVAVVNSVTSIKRRGDPEDKPQEYYQKALLDRQFWNYPFILSTHVSFFSILFDNHREALFGFYQLAGSVVVLDEIQSYRNAVWTEIMIFLNSCAELMNMKFIIMSATLPGMDWLVDGTCSVKRLLPQAQKYYEHPLFHDRVKISYEMLSEKMTLDCLLEHVIKNKGKKILITLIKKDSAYKLYEVLSHMDLGNTLVMLITGDDSQYDRERILRPIKEGKVQDIILVSTQVVEAGIDIDMDIGYKDISKLDSEEQFLGRINRSCKRNGNAYFFDMDSANRIYSDDYRIDQEFTLKNIEMREMLETKNFAQYYQRVMQALKTKCNDSTSSDGLETFFSESVKKLNFPAIERRMRLIQEDNWHMNVVLCRSLVKEDGAILDGRQIWQEYKSLLKNQQLEYAEKRVRLSDVCSKLSNFIYMIKKNPDLLYDDIIGELICIYEGDKYFENDKLNKTKLEDEGVLFLE